MELKPGLEGRAETTVELADTALEVGSGSLSVYATPCMAALMEGAAYASLEEALPERKTAPAIHERFLANEARFFQTAYDKLKIRCSHHRTCRAAGPPAAAAAPQGLCGGRCLRAGNRKTAPDSVIF